MVSLVGSGVTKVNVILIRRAIRRGLLVRSLALAGRVLLRMLQDIKEKVINV
jgi:hypothetical protein